MDRDMVNCFHYLYQWGDIPLSKLEHEDTRSMLFWCGPDTRYPLRGMEVVVEDTQSQVLRFAPGILNLIDSIESQLRSLPNPDFVFGYPISAAVRAVGEPRPAFLAISYASEFDAVKQAILDAAGTTGFDCEVTGDLRSAAGTVMDQVWQGIRSADVVVADISANNPNVFYEVGLAHALGKEVVLITQDQIVPFDVRATRRIKYDPLDLPQLRIELEEAFKQVTARYPFEGVEPRF